MWGHLLLTATVPLLQDLAFRRALKPLAWPLRDAEFNVVGRSGVEWAIINGKGAI
jgi:hypothetical protein